MLPDNRHRPNPPPERTPGRPQVRSRGRPSREEAANLRQCILDAALAAFLDHGFAASSMERIARDAGVAKLTLYRHFESKEQLFIEVARRAQLDVRHRLDDLPGDQAPLEQVLRDIIEKLYDGYTQPQYLAVMRMVTSQALRFPKLGRAMLSDSSHVVEPLVDYLQRLKDDGRIDIESAYDAATQICGMASGAGRYLLVPPSRHPEARRHWVESLVRLFVRAWRRVGD